MSGTISKQYRKKALAERDIPDDFAFPTPIFPPVPKARQKAKREAERKEKADAKFRAKNTLPKPRICTPYQKVKVGNASQRIKKSGSEPRDTRTRNKLGRDNSNWEIKCSIS